MTGRRAFLRGALAAGATGAAGLAAGSAAGSAAKGAAHTGAPAARGRAFHGEHQAGVLEAPARRTIVASFDVIADGRAELTELLRALTERARILTSGGPPEEAGIAAPPADSGVLGPDAPGAGLMVTVGAGASLFDDRFGLAARKPPGLLRMRTFPHDALEAGWCHGDLSVQLSADDEDTVVHALRDITRHSRGAAQLRWRISGFSSPPRPGGTPRNLMGFKDGTANPDASDAREMDRLVWLSERDLCGGTTPHAPADRPCGAAGGTYAAIRLIRMLVEFWDRVGLPEQEQMLGRARDTGAPLDGVHETDEPRYAEDPVGEVIPLTSHIRRANPRTPGSAGSRILRRAFNYDRGMDGAGDLDMGLIFTAYQRDLRRQFEAVQDRLADEPLTDYVRPFGGGYFLVFPGVRDASDFLGRGLIT
ncbi:Dyp-type peroxidase [Actinomadura macra]|uniref:Dyp-type peroxidase n=1 Tax=Actinomadura macra TaxID=46164 RepID=UPI000836CCA4|nr:Dyp-type peroxidase [Actinomadura macra]